MERLRKAIFQLLTMDAFVLPSFPENRWYYRGEVCLFYYISGNFSLNPFFSSDIAAGFFVMDFKWLDGFYQITDKQRNCQVHYHSLPK